VSQEDTDLRRRQTTSARLERLMREFDCANDDIAEYRVSAL
jgi:hypothetical protein